MSLISDVLRDNRTFALVGVSQNREKYGYEVFEALIAKGYRVGPINPKHEQVDGHVCYSSLDDLPETPDVVVTAVPSAVTEKVVQSCPRLGVDTVWMPPGSWSEQAVQACEEQGIEEIHDVCPVFALRSVRGVPSEAQRARFLDAAPGRDRGAVGDCVGAGRDQEMLADLVQRQQPHLGRLLTGELPTIGLPDASVDRIWAAFVFHEVEPPEQMAAEMRRVIRPGGRVAVLDWRPDAPGSNGPEYSHRLSAARVIEHLRAAGFRNASRIWQDEEAYLVGAY